MARRCRHTKQPLPSLKESDFYQRKGFADLEAMAAYGIKKAREYAARKISAQEKEKRAEHRVAKERIKTRREWMVEAQASFNAYIRARDESQGLPCICCGEYGDGLHGRGGEWDAGHFLSRGAYPELRFVEINCHRQLKSCNAGSSKYAKKGRTVREGYRERLIQRIGLDKVEWLEGPHELPKYTIDELKAIKAEYKAKLKELSIERMAA